MKKIITILLFLLIMCLVSCSSGTVDIGFNSGSSNTTLVPTLLAITTPENASVDELVPVIFYYGHDSTEDDHGQNVRKDIFEITLVYCSSNEEGTQICVNGVCNTVVWYNNIVLYNEEVEDLYIESNRVSITDGLFMDKVEFPSSFSLEIDFETVPFETGQIVFKLFEYMTFSEDENESFVVVQSLYFEIKDGQVRFSLTSPV